MAEDYQIYKAAGIIIQHKKQLLERSKNKEFFIEPGGSIEEGETPKQALVRGLWEELSIEVEESDLEPFGTFYDAAAGQEHLRIRMDVFMVKKWSGEIHSSHEVEELIWVTSDLPTDIKVGSIFKNEVLPKLKKEGLIE
jgi:8-oxo-dGTP diphosphatase